MLKVFAPKVVSPPWAKRTAWKISTIMPKTLAEDTPKRMAERPVPVMWLQLPVTEGIFREEITKINAPDIASKIMVWGFSMEMCFKVINPCAAKGRQITPHRIQCTRGRYPSIMCMAETSSVSPKNTEKVRTAK